MAAVSRSRALVARAVIAATLLGSLIVLVPLAHRVLDTIEARPVRQVRSFGDAAPPAAHTPEFLQAMMALTGVMLAPGHELEVIADATLSLERLWADIRGARQSLLLQSYYCDPGRVTDTLVRLLSARSRAGVRVLFLRDGFGCAGLGKSALDSLRAAGVETAEVRPVHWYSLHRAQHRSHVRAVIVDGRVAYTGGFGFADQWIAGSPPAAWMCAF